MSWVHRLLGKDGTSQMGVDSTHFAARISGRPMHVGTRGAYGLAAFGGVIAAGAGANSEVFQFRWTDGTRKCLLRSVVLGVGGITGFTAGTCYFGLRIARSWSADGTGGTAITFAGNDQKKRTDFATTLAPSNAGVRIHTTAALGAGTKTLDGNDLAGIGGSVTATAGTALVNPGTYLWQRNTHDEYPILFEQNEGFVVRGTVPATGTWTCAVSLEWAEVDPAEVEGWT